MKKLSLLTLLFLLAAPFLLLSQNAKLRFQEHKEFHKQVMERKELLKDDPAAMVRGLQIPAGIEAASEKSKGWIMRMDSTVSQYFDVDTGLWLMNWKSDYLYNNFQIQTGQTDFLWDLTSGAWVNDYKDEYTFVIISQPDDILIESITTSFWDEISGQWVYAYKDEYFYDSTNQRVDVRIFSEWDNASTQFENYYKMEYSYNASGMVEEVISWFWDEIASVWILSGRDEYSYSSTWYLVDEITSYFWLDFMSQYIPFNRRDFTYYPSDLVHTIISNEFDQIAMQFEADYKDEFTYNGAGTMLTKTGYMFDKMLSQFIESEKEERTINASGAVTSIIFSIFNSSTSQWMNEYRSDLTSNSSYTFNQLLLPFSIKNEGIDDIFNFMLTRIDGLYYDEVAAAWVADYISDLYYTNQPYSVEELSRGAVRIYPNPASSHINFELSDILTSVTLELFDIQGRRVLQDRVSDGAAVDVSNIGKGVYLYRLTSEQKFMQNGKIIIQ